MREKFLIKMLSRQDAEEVIADSVVRKK